MFASAHASSRHQFTVATPAGEILVEGFENCGNPTCPAVMILSGSRGFGASAYDDIAETLQAAGLNAYLVHVVSDVDLDTIAKAGSAQARIAYYAQRLQAWITAVHGVAAYLENQARHGGKIGLLGISLGAQIASAASNGQSHIDALVLVDGGFPNGYSQPVRALPPLLLIWGSKDRTFPPSIGRALKQKAQQLGGPAALNVYEGGVHAFFLQSGTRNAAAARQSAAGFFIIQFDTQ